MKVNEAPKKLYVDIEDGFRDSFLYGYVEKRRKDDIEYVRTDAFIERAVKWLMDNIQDYTDDGMGEHSFVLVQDLKEHFKNYMKGE